MISIWAETELPRIAAKIPPATNTHDEQEEGEGELKQGRELRWGGTDA